MVWGDHTVVVTIRVLVRTKMKYSIQENSYYFLLLYTEQVLCHEIQIADYRLVTHFHMPDKASNKRHLLAYACIIYLSICQLRFTSVCIQIPLLALVICVPSSSHNK